MRVPAPAGGTNEIGDVPVSTQAATTAPDPDKVIEMALRVWGYKQGEVVSLMIHLGDRLGLYRALQRSGPVTASDLA
jgi:hypothetical protein